MRFARFATAASWIAPAAATVALAACTGDNPMDPPGDGGSGLASCVSAPTACPEPAVHYSDVAPIILEKCVYCHNGTGEIWALADYQHVADWADLVRTELLGCTMPPADAGISLAMADRLAILTWIRCGAPE
jgi:hypothetical protein